METLLKSHAFLLSVDLGLNHSPSAQLRWDYLGRLSAESDNHIAILSKSFRTISCPMNSFSLEERCDKDSL